MAATSKGRKEALDVFVAMLTIDPTFLALDEAGKFPRRCLVS